MKNNFEKIRTIKAKKIKIGTILQTRDEFFKDNKNYRKPGYEDKGNYRKAGVIGKNANDELALVKFVTNGYLVVDNSNLRYRPYIETLDEESKPIRVGSKFIPTKKVLSKRQVKSIKNNCIHNSSRRIRKINKDILKEFYSNKKTRVKTLASELK